MRARRTLVYILTILSLALCSSCDIEYRDSADASVSILVDGNVRPDTMKVDLVTGQSGVVYRSVMADPSTESVVFPALLFGSYTVNAYGYVYDHSGERLVAMGTAELTTEDKGANSTSLTLSPITDSSYTGTVKAEILLEKDRSIRTAADTLSLISNGHVLATRDIAGTGSQPYMFEEDIPCMTTAKAHFQISIGDYPVGSSEEFDLAVYAGQTTDLGRVDIIPDEDVIIIDSVKVEYSKTSSDSLGYSFIPPDSTTGYRCVIVRYGDGQATYSFELSKDEIDEATGDGMFYTGTISGLREGTLYSVAIGIEFEDGSFSPFVQETASTAVPLKNVSINRIPEDMQPGDSCQLTLSLNPSDATDLGGTWTSSDESVASVDQDGLLTITGYGQVTIRYTAANGNRSARLAINISLTAPELALVPEDDSIHLSWTSSVHADSFEIYRKESGQSGDGDLMATTEDHSYTDTDILSGHTYTYRIKATDTEHGVSAWSDWSADVAFKPAVIEISVEKPESLAIVMSGMSQDQMIGPDDEIQVSVNEIEGIVGYGWFINDKLVSNQREFILDGSMPVFDVSQEAGTQLLTLYLYSADGKIHSGCLRFIYKDAPDIEKTLFGYRGNES